MRRLILSLCIVSYFLLTTGAANAAQTVCNCEDMAQIQQRVEVVNGAIAAYTNQYLSTPPATDFTMKGHDAVEAAVLAAVNGAPVQLGSPFVKNPPSDTTRFRCVIEILDDGATGCMKESLHAHEAVHQAACQNSWGIRRQWATLNDFIKEEMDAYTAERDFLRQERKRLLCTCPYYALRVNAAGSNTIMLPFEKVGGEFQASGVKKPEIEIPIKIDQAGTVTGQADAMISGHEAATGIVGCGITAGEPMTVTANGQLTPTPGHHSSLHVDLSRKPTKQTNSGECTAPPPVGVVNVGGTVNNPNSGKFPFTVNALDAPDTKTIPFAPPWVYWTMSTEMSVAEPWPSTKASNGRGSTVGEALHEIGMPDCP
jgi:hypothetical protein